ncbi:hypothetical protein [Flavobacterium cerinum]|uniref:Uncharacterized protein n=1 Tax=Flavobacterium cerinum TaxID=2502784 RepID=A0A3S3QZJ0_9FLAO|nr:hypothetical protein [Flavobacterium cerinum]RWW99553.1 hypothetical protein EPI11_11410 [Flavobacterium cerinum]
MKKKLEAELISIAHRILKLKNRAELDQLQQETLKLYEKISVLRFVEDNFSEIKPTIGFASAEETLEEVYGLEEQPEVKANEIEKEEAKAKADAAAVKIAEEAKKEEKPVAVKEEVTQAVVEPVKEELEEEKEELEEAKEIVEDEIVEEPVAAMEIEKPAGELKAMEESAEAVFTKPAETTIEEQEKASDAEIATIAPDESVKVEESGIDLDFAFERTAAPEVPQKQKEITFEDYHDYKEPEFVKKSDSEPAKKAEPIKEEPVKEEEEVKPVVRDWRDWEPGQSDKKETVEEPKKEAEEPKQEIIQPQAVVEEPKKEIQKPKEEGSTVIGNRATRSADTDRPKTLNDSLGKTISLTLNDRIAFEKQLFGGSGEDLNRVLSQLNTMNNYEDAKSFIEDLVKPDYNDWAGKEEYAERFMGIVEKKFD